jgi:hypothetical protein
VGDGDRKFTFFFSSTFLHTIISLPIHIQSRPFYHHSTRLAPLFRSLPNNHCHLYNATRLLPHNLHLSFFCHIFLFFLDLDSNPYISVNTHPISIILPPFDAPRSPLSNATKQPPPPIHCHSPFATNLHPSLFITFFFFFLTFLQTIISLPIPIQSRPFYHHSTRLAPLFLLPPPNHCHSATQPPDTPSPPAPFPAVARLVLDALLGSPFGATGGGRLAAAAALGEVPANLGVFH